MTTHLLAYLLHLKLQRPLDEPPPPDLPGASGQPQITNIDLLNGDAEITVQCPLVENAEWIEWYAGSNAENWENGTSENPNISFTMNEVVFQTPRQQEDDNSFFCYRGVNEGGAGSTSCNGFVVPGENPSGGTLGAPDIHTISAPAHNLVVLGIAGGENADDHDVHRIQGIQDFTAGPGNLIEEDIDQAPDEYLDDSVQANTPYSYRVVAKAEDQTSVPSNRRSITTPLEPEPGTGGPNEPLGFQLWADHDCTTLPNGSQLSGAGFGTDISGNSNYSIIADPNAPNGAAIRVRFGEGHLIGTSPGRFWVSDTGDSATSTRLRRWYLRFIWQVEPNPVDGLWEAPQNEQKLWYGVTAGRTANVSGTITMNRGGPHLSLTDSFGLKWSGRTTADSCVTAVRNVGPSGIITVGPYHECEMVGEWSSPDAADATFQFWHNGTLRRTETVQNHFNPDPACGPPRVTPFRELLWSPVWGGSCTTCGGKPNRKQRTDHLRLAYFYMSGIPF